MRLPTLVFLVAGCAACGPMRMEVVDEPSPDNGALRAAANPVIAGPRVVLNVGPLGDSLTAGRGATNDNGFRRYLYERALGVGYPIDFFGLSAGGDFPDNRHTGISGADVARCARAVDDYLAPGKRFHERGDGLVLLLIGSADVLNGVPVNDLAPSYAALLEALVQALPELRALVVSTLPPLPHDPPGIAQYNAAYGEIWDRFAADHPAIRLVRVDSNQALGGAYDPTLFVGVHPNDVGYELMGAAYWSELAPVLNELTRAPR